MEKREYRKQFWTVDTIANVWFLLVLTVIISACIYNYVVDSKSDLSYTDIHSKNESVYIIK